MGSGPSEDRESIVTGYQNRIRSGPWLREIRRCIRGTRVTVGLIVGMLAGDHDRNDVLKLYPYLSSDDMEAVRESARRREDEAI